jgi:hypothetical protein
MFNDFELFSSQYTDFIDSGKEFTDTTQVQVFVVINEFQNRQLQMQLSQKLQRFRIYRKNKKCSIFHELPEYVQKWATFFPLDWSFNTFLCLFFAKYVN